MAKTDREFADESTLEAALARAAARLIDDYKAISPERRRLHDMVFDVDPAIAERADDALYLTLVPLDDVVATAGLLAGRPDDAARRRYADTLERSLLVGQDSLIGWTRDVAGCREVASLIQRTNDLRLILLSILTPAAASKQSA